MTNELKKPSKRNGSNLVGGAAAGASGGTLLILLAQNLPESSELRSWLMIIAPSVSLLLSSIWQWAKRKIEYYFTKTEFNSAVEEAKKTLTEALNNSETTDSHKEELIKELEQLEMVAIKAKVKRVEVLAK